MAKKTQRVAGLPTRWGSPSLHDSIAARDVAALVWLHEADAVAIGQTKPPAEFTDWQADSALHGRTVKPWDADRSCGDSSGGSAVAARLTELEVGRGMSSSISHSPMHVASSGMNRAGASARC
ncbi:amidase family protein [Muricoccus pecuniae]|uniref:amidase family protein n=1 Tax=Muricoccus pecuniae TaxID=693023 RepID=UPI001621B93D